MTVPPTQRERDIADSWRRANMLAEYREELLAPFAELADRMDGRVVGSGDEVRAVIARARGGT